MHPNQIITTILFIVLLLGCKQKSLQRIDYAKIQKIVQEALTEKLENHNQGSTPPNHKRVLDVIFEDTLDIVEFRIDKFLFGSHLDTTNLFSREDYTSLIESNSNIIIQNQADCYSNLSSKYYQLNIVKQSKSQYHNDTLGVLIFYPLIYDITGDKAIQAMLFSRGDDGFAEAYFLNKIKGDWKIVARKLLFVS